jgi:RNA polymerase sigma factor (sigma-70 family)
MGIGGDEVVATIQENAAALLGIAQRYSICVDDAHDAYQRTLEIFIRRAPTLDRERVNGWLRTVVKHEALAVRASRQQLVGGPEGEREIERLTQEPAAEERVLSFERVSAAAEALARLKPHEVTALLLRAEGHSYASIAEQTGWSLRKVNRLLSEGRQSFLERVAGIESGEECERWAEVLSAMADGEASSEDVILARPHLRNCAACRARLREYHEAPTHVAALVPPLLGGGLVGRRGGGLLTRLYEALSGGVHERIAAAVQKGQAGLEVAGGGKVAMLAASATALAGSGFVAVIQKPHIHPHRVARTHLAMPAAQLSDSGGLFSSARHRVSVVMTKRRSSRTERKAPEEPARSTAAIARANAHRLPRDSGSRGAASGEFGLEGSSGGASKPAAESASTGSSGPTAYATSSATPVTSGRSSSSQPSGGEFTP